MLILFVIKGILAVKAMPKFKILKMKLKWISYVGLISLVRSVRFDLVSLGELGFILLAWLVRLF
jgi:hypothetical protein